MNQNDTDELRRAVLYALPFLALGTQASAQDAAKVQPQSYRVAFENDKVRVLEYTSRPGMGVCGNGMHSHPAHLTVLLSNAAVRVTTGDGKVEQHDDMRLGEVFWSEAETHVVENIGGNNVRSLIIELKSGHA